MAACCLLVINLLIVANFGFASETPKDIFNEELYLKNLPSGHVYAHFQFTTTWNITLGSKNSFSHFHLFPKSFGEILHKFSARELHLSLTQGRWRHESWGYPVIDAAPGAELWVWFMESQTNIDSLWTDLINVLSGMFCASLNFMDTKTTAVPMFGFRPLGVTTTNYDKHFTKHVRYASLPRENVCTENLTPWKKLLPCGSKAGLSTLLNAIRIYDASYHSLAVNFRPICMDDGCTNVGVELSQSVSVVFDPVVLAQLMGRTGKYDWSLKKLFSKMITSSCPLASKSAVYVDVSSNDTRFTLNPAPTQFVETVRGTGSAVIPVRYAVYDIPQSISTRRVLNVDVAYDHDSQPNPSAIKPPALTAHRFQTGHGRATGGIMCLINNHHETDSLVVAYQEIIPWFLRVYLHTLKIETFPSLPQSVDEAGTPLKPLHQHYVPGKDRQRYYHLELVLRLPAKSVTRLSFEFERQLLKWTEYPPDANHGFYIGSAVISTVLPDAQNYTSTGQKSSVIDSIFDGSSVAEVGFFVRLHTETLLVSLPTPDFSMPYNVICLACTVIAIAFGSVHNLTTRRFVILDPSASPGLLTRIRQRLGAIFSFFRRKKPVATAESLVPTVDVEVEEVGAGANDGVKVNDGADSGVNVVGGVGDAPVVDSGASAGSAE